MSIYESETRRRLRREVRERDEAWHICKSCGGEGLIEYYYSRSALVGICGDCDGEGGYYAKQKS